ncbi:MAG: amidase family protein [Pseudomonadota bacterium]|nr:amidase family protein [Pseudomonadota bacterium]
MKAFADYDQYDATGLAELIKSGQVTAEELLLAAIERADQHDELNATIQRFDEKALAKAESVSKEVLFAGVPTLIKDLGNFLAGEPITMGSQAIDWVPDYDDEFIQRYKATGVIPFGKTNVPELGINITTEPKRHGPTHNPHKKGYSSGGSSGGSAAAVAAGIVPIATANDGGGSIRFPASWCGVFGLKPSRGRVPLGPDEAEGWSGAVAGHELG